MPDRWSLAAKVGMGLTGLILALAYLGPLFAPHGPAEILGAPFAAPSSQYPLGLDYLGRDVLSRFLSGGLTTVTMALVATLAATVFGAAVGLTAAYTAGAFDFVVGRTVEVVLALPALILTLLLITGLGSGLSAVVLAVTVANAPRVLRLARGAALEVCQLDFVLVARARGERAGYTLVREVLPSVMPVLLVDFGVRFSGSVVLVAGLSFLGLGVQQPQADWGLIISENREALTFRPLTVIPSVIAIALLTIGVNLVIDGRRRRGR